LAADNEAQDDGAPKAARHIDSYFALARKKAENGIYDVITMQAASNAARLAGIRWENTAYERQDLALRNHAEVISALKEISRIEERMLRGEWIDVVQLLEAQQSALKYEIRCGQRIVSICRDSDALTKGYVTNTCKDAQVALGRVERLIVQAKSKAARAHRESVRRMEQSLSQPLPSRFIMPNGRLDRELLCNEGWHAIRPEKCMVFNFRSGKFRPGFVKA
jgi:hypothetical protein